MALRGPDNDIREHWKSHDSRIRYDFAPLTYAYRHERSPHASARSNGELAVAAVFLFYWRNLARTLALGGGRTLTQEASIPPEVPTASDGVPWATIAQSLYEGRTVPFLGAGASAAHRLKGDAWKAGAKFGPFGAELGAHLAKLGEFPEDDAQDDLTLIASYYEAVIGRDTMVRELEVLFANKRLSPGPVHRLLAMCPRIPLIMTTNYDCLIEKAMREKRIKFDVVIQNQDRLLLRRGDRPPAFKIDNEGLRDLFPDSDSGSSRRRTRQQPTIIYKMHGSLENPPVLPIGNPDPVISTGDYISALKRGENYMPTHLLSMATQRRLLFLGYSLKDWNVRVMLGRLNYTRETSWSFQQRNLPAEAKLWSKYGVETHHVDLGGAAERLITEVEKVKDLEALMARDK
jgi:hypothetical protein